MDLQSATRSVRAFLSRRVSSEGTESRSFSNSSVSASPDSSNCISSSSCAFAPSRRFSILVGVAVVWPFDEDSVEAIQSQSRSPLLVAPVSQNVVGEKPRRYQFSRIVALQFSLFRPLCMGVALHGSRNHPCSVATKLFPW